MLRTENLIALFERFGGAAGISRECKKNGVTIDPVTIGQIKNGTPLPSGNPRGIGDKLADKLEKGLLLPARWMDTPNATSETGTMQKHDSNSITIEQFNDVSGSMGVGVMLRDQPGQITEWIATPEWVNKNIPANSGNKNLRIITGFGDSMRGMFNSGDPLIVDIGITTVEYDAVYFFRVANEGFIKRLQRVPGRGLVAISENKAYESWPITNEMDFEVFGRVLKAWQSEEF